MQETCVRSLGWENPLEYEIATHSSILAWEIPCLHLVTKQILWFLMVYYFFLCFKSFSFFKFYLFFISWRLITVQYCSGFCHILTWVSHWYTCISHPDPPLPPPSPPDLSGSPQCTRPKHLSHASSRGWWSVSP